MYTVDSVEGDSSYLFFSLFADYYGYVNMSVSKFTFWNDSITGTEMLTFMDISNFFVEITYNYFLVTFPSDAKSEVAKSSTKRGSTSVIVGAVVGSVLGLLLLFVVIFGNA
jgi:hypothetical protein